jgi:hypothetical protein
MARSKVFDRENKGRYRIAGYTTAAENRRTTLMSSLMTMTTLGEADV